MTPVFCCGMECGVATAHWTLSNASFVTTPVNNDARALRCNAAPGFSGATSPTLTSATRWVGRLYIRFATLPSASTGLIAVDGTPTGPNVRFNSADSKLYAAVGITAGATGVAVTTGVWYRIDFDFNIATAANDTCDVRVDGTVCGQATAAGLSAGQTALTLGAFSNVTHDVYFDDVVLSNTGADYPIGAGKVLSFVPNADGTHTSTTTNITEGTAATPVGTAITSATTDAFNWVNARPIGGGATDATRLINQRTVAATEYAEVDFEATTETNPPRAVEVLTGDQQASTAAGVFQTKLNDNGTENAIVNRGSAAGQTTDRWVTKQYALMPADNAAWTLARFNALKARFGYSSDATPDQYWRGIMIEAEFAVAGGNLTLQVGDDLNAAF